MMNPQMPGQTNVNDTWNFNGPRLMSSHLDTLAAAHGTSLTIPSTN